MEEDRHDEDHLRAKLKNIIAELTADIQTLESSIQSGNVLRNVPNDFLCVELPPPTDVNDLVQKKHQPSQLSKLSELSAVTAGFKLGKVSRKLRFSPDELYVYDCLVEGRTPSVKFRVKFTESVKGPKGEYGEISDMEADLIMVKGDPEALSDWISTCCMAGDIPKFVDGLVQFSELADNRRCVLRSLCKRSKCGQFGSNKLLVIGEGDGVMVVGSGPDEEKLFSINWKIQYCHATMCMRPTFEIELHEQDLQYESAEVFAALERPFIPIDDLPQLWDAIADTLS